MATHGNALPRDYKLGEYRLVSVLGEGGFGITYTDEPKGSSTPSPGALRAWPLPQWRLDTGAAVRGCVKHSARRYYQAEDTNLGWSDAPEEVRAAVRYHESVADHEAGVGFRVVGAPDP